MRLLAVAQKSLLQIVLMPEPIFTLLPKLLAVNLLANVPLRPVSNPPPPNHDPNARCQYHMDASRYSTEIVRLKA